VSRDLTDNEHDALHRLIAGKSTEEIGTETRRKPVTIRGLIASCRDKMEVATTAQMVAIHTFLCMDVNFKAAMWREVWLRTDVDGSHASPTAKAVT